MCEICHQYPCHPRCPNAPEPPIIANCQCCNTPIYIGDEYYDIEGDIYCDECVSNTWFDEEDKDKTECFCCREAINYDDECYKVDNKYYCNECVTKKIADDEYL